MNAHALDVLQYREALEVVSGYASSTLGREALRALTPSDARGWAEPELRRVEEMVNFILRSEDWHIPTIPDLRGPLRRLAIDGSVWEARELLDTAELIRSARQLRRSVLRYAEDFPSVAAVVERMAKLEDEEAAIRRAIDDHGEVKDDASPELARLRRDLRAARGRIVQRLERFLASMPERIRVPDASVTLREGRYVVAVRREGRGEVGGIVHDESASGNTLFMEPPVAIELMNRLRELELAEAREVMRILRELTRRMRPHHEALSDTLDALVELDSVQGRARYALACDGRRPELLPPGTEEYRVVRGMHPLLLAGQEPVVPFDLHMEEGERTLLVSGPNTGGKTVLLKAVGLLSLMAQSGIIPPVGPESRLPIFREIFADIGDEQSIEASLSTFSAHLKNLREILEGADHESLVLIDEIGSGTDPAEGGALAEAILVDLTRRGGLTVATTHLGRLKKLAGEERGVVNASLQFDARELRPTYRLHKGVPGRSYGLAIARRLGFPAPLVERAEALVPQEERDAEQLLRDLEEKEAAAAESLLAARRAEREAATLRDELKTREADLVRREEDAERRSRQQARDLLLHAREEVEAAIRALREQSATAEAGALEEAATAARRRVEEAAARQAERTPTSTRHARTGAPVLEVGARVRVRATGATGRVVELRDGRATVETGGLRLQMPSAELEPIAGEEPKRRAPSATGWAGPTPEARSEVDLRGLRAEDVASALHPALDAAVVAELPSLRIIHGKGTGALREVVQEILATDRRVVGQRPGGVGEGGTGVTVAELR